MILTIAIPTYNRPDKIKNTVVRLLPQLTSNVKILILDNCSLVPVKDHLEKEIGIQVSERVEVVRNRVNIGADSNFQKCFELCTTPYIWQLGDDDEVESNAVEIILSDLKKYESLDLIGVNFQSNCMEVERPVPIFIKSTEELAEKLDHFGNWLFISTTVYKTEEYLKHIRFQAWGAYSMASQLVPPMVAISQNKTFVLSEKYIVTNIPEPPEIKWSNFQMALSLPTLLEAPVGFKKDEFRKFGKSMAFLCSIYPGDELCIILKSVDYNIDLIDNYHVHIYQQQFWRSFTFRNKQGVQLIQYYVCLFLLKNKGVLKLVFRLIPKIKRKSEEKVAYSLFKR